jgi:hypothetical protein
VASFHAWFCRNFPDCSAAGKIFCLCVKNERIRRITFGDWISKDIFREKKRLKNLRPLTIVSLPVQGILDRTEQLVLDEWLDDIPVGGNIPRIGDPLVI